MSRVPGETCGLFHGRGTAEGTGTERLAMCWVSKGSSVACILEKKLVRFCYPDVEESSTKAGGNKRCHGS